MLHLRNYAHLALLFGILLFAESFAIAEGLVDEQLPKTWQNESALRDVHFIDTQRGWAVGDHGVILKTTDGQNWNAVADVNRSVADWNHAGGELSLREKLQGVKDKRVQDTVSTSKSRSHKVTCRLDSVFFLNERQGWAAGGFAVPLLDRTRSVVLKTTDGGVNWRVVSKTIPPHIKHLEFTDAHTGWAIGDSSSSFGSGIYFTRDGGQSWKNQPLADRRSRHDWVAASCFDRRGKRVVGVSRSGQLKFSQGNKVDNAAVLADRKQHFHDVVMTDAKNGWAVGSLGAIFRTRDQGLSWQAPAQLKNSDTPTEQSRAIGLIDFQSVATTKTKVWAAGKPGGCIVSIDKKSGAAKLHPTPIKTSIHRISFVDESHGWAVGDLGIGR